MTDEERKEVLALVDPILVRIQVATRGAPVAAAAYALLTYAVVIWRETGLPLEGIHDTLRLLVENSELVATAAVETRN